MAEKGWTLALCGVVALTGQTAAASDGMRHAYVSADELRRRLLCTDGLIASMWVRYRAVSQISRTGVYSVREVAAMRPGWLYHHGAHGTRGMSWQDDPWQQRAWVNAEGYIDEFPLVRKYYYDSLSASERLPGTLNEELWLELTGFWPLKARKPPRAWNVGPMLCEIAGSAEYCVVRSELEEVEGAWCHVLERRGGGDRVWLDAERGCCLMRREASAPKEGRRYGVAELAGHTEAVPGVWVPRRIRNRVFSGVAGEDKAIIDSVIQVLEVSVNSVPHEVFEFRPPAGSVSGRAEEFIGLARQTEPGGVEYLDELVGWIGRVHGVPKLGRAGRQTMVAGVVVVGTTCLIMAAEVWRRRRNVRQKGT